MSDISGTCSYNCKPNGNCKVTENIQFVKGGKKYKATHTSSCFSVDFGGDCKGKLNVCQPCKGICEHKSPGKADEFQIPIDQPTSGNIP